MPGIDRALGRVVALITLILLAGAALRGYIPAAGPAAGTRAAGEGRVSAVPMIVLLSVSLGIVAVAFVARLRNRRPVPASVGALATGRAGGKHRPSYRVLLIGVALLTAWLVMVWSLTRLVGQHHVGFLVRMPAPGGGDVPGTGSAGSPAGGEPGTQGPQPDSGGNAFGLLAACGIALLCIVAGAVVGGRVRRTSGPVSPPAGGHPPGPDALARAAELGLIEAGNTGHEPRDAIIGCYATMERELARVPDAAPQDFDTPTEVLARAVEHRALRAANAAQLVELFTEARFSPHPMTELHRQKAIRILRLVLAELGRA